MPELLFLHQLDALLSCCPEGDEGEGENTPPHILITPGCGHPPATTAFLEAVPGVLTVVCRACGDQVGIAVDGGSQVQGGGAHGAPRVALYSAGQLALCCAECLEPIRVWDVRPYMMEAP
jgi:hypothetical protein